MNGADAGAAERAVASALAALEQGRVEEAERLCRQALDMQPRHAQAMQVWGMAAYRGGNLEAAAERLSKAVALAPGFAHMRAQLGEILRQLGRLAEAQAQVREAVRLSPQTAEFQLTLGNILRDAGDANGAIAAYHQAATLAPALRNAWWNLGEMLVRRQDFASALTCYQNAMPAGAGPADACVAMGLAARQAGHLTAAEQAYRAALEHRPNDFDSLAMLANILRETARIDEAIERYRAALRIASHPVVESNLLLALNASDRVAPEEVFEEHRRWGERAEELAGPARTPEVDATPGRRLRIGYVSPDFRDHSVWKWLEPILVNHDRGRFEIIGYSATSKPDAVTERVKARCDAWRDISGMSDEDAAELVRADRVDILVDLAGHTADNRLMIFARRPAPVQVSYLGYPNTTGLGRMNHLITDEHLDPAGKTERFHTEQLVRLPGCFACYQGPADAPPVSPPPSQDLGWRRGTGFINFGSFNSFSKLSPSIIEAWAKLLNRVGDAHLVFKSSTHVDGGALRRIWQKLEAAGVNPMRLHSAPRHPAQGEHLAAYSTIDIALDSYPYHGTTTTCDALWMGVPVVTLAGPTHASRVGVSLLKNVGLGELVAGSFEEYVEMAARLAMDAQRLAALRSTLRQRLAESPLMNGAAFTRKLEEALAGMWERRGGGDKG